MGIVSTIPEKCKRCYTCIRECPAKAIKVEKGQATVIEERCIACGNRVKVCAQQAKLIEDGIRGVRELLAQDKQIFACLAPSFPAAFDKVAPGKVIAAVKRLGFTQVWEVAFGAEFVSKAYAELFRRNSSPRVIATACPAIVAYVEKYMPSLQPSLAPIVSPMVATGRAIHKKYPGAKVVFIGPCIAKKNEILDPCVKDSVDAVLTFKELAKMFEEDGIDPQKLPEETIGGPKCLLGRSFPISGGLLKTAGLSTDILENEIVITEGKDRVLAALSELNGGSSRARFFDILFCEGCISGPKMLNDLSVFARREILANFVKERNRKLSETECTASLSEFSDTDLHRTFTCRNFSLAQPSEQDIQRSLQALRKFEEQDQLNCGACGYPSCRENAIAVCQGLAEPGMCLPYVVEELEETCGRLQQSRGELASAQQRLILTERLASMGQLSAAVAHEINNPLGTILLYSHMLLKQLHEDDKKREDVAMVLSEATRCKNIVRGLLDFARQTRVSKTPTNISALAQEVLLIAATRASAAGIKLESDISAAVPQLMIDAAQIKQMLVNLVQNGMDAVASGGKVGIRARMSGDAQVEIEVYDNGCGIPEQNLSQLFTPFFTTKASGKGTGLGLSIVYGIVKMHSGDVSVDSTVGKGTVVTVTLPVRAPEKAVEAPVVREDSANSGGT